LSEGWHLAIKDLTLMTPDGSRTLFAGVSLAVDEGGALLITGASGAGKTSLMRAVAGLWDRGNGRVERPPLEETIFLPQRPYMILGSLRDQLRYPRAIHATDQALLEALSDVNLGDLPTRLGGLDVEVDWASVLSVGEQQRLAFARLLLNRPRYAFLDEATSALDSKNEELLYARLARLPTTIISLGHRPSLRRFHTQVLELRSNPSPEADLELAEAK
jgi:putative ATP-binding cassette transporter